jgi:hypothetical protein
MPFRKPLLGGLGLPEGFRGGSGVSEVLAAFVTTPATMCGNHDDWALQLDRRCLQSRSWVSTADWQREWDSKPELAIFPIFILKQMRAVETGISVLPSMKAIIKC